MLKVSVANFCRRRTMKIYAVMAAASLAAPNVVLASQIQSVRGSITVSRGGVDLAAQEGMQLIPGDRVKANQGASAIISYGNGCNAVIGRATTTAISSRSPCWAPPSHATGESPGHFGESAHDGWSTTSQAPGEQPVHIDTPENLEPTNPQSWSTAVTPGEVEVATAEPPSFFTPTTVVLGAAAAGGVAAVVAAASQSSSPASP